MFERSIFRTQDVSDHTGQFTFKHMAFAQTSQTIFELVTRTTEIINTSKKSNKC